MKASKVLATQQLQWQELDRMCAVLESRSRSKLSADDVSRFASLYRSACADLALADARQLPPNTVQYLHRLVGRAHNQLYRARGFDTQAWAKILLEDVPRAVFNDGCVQVAFILFWGVFILSAVLAYSDSLWPNYATSVIPESSLEMMEENFSQPIKGRNAGANMMMAAFYIRHNTGIGLQCFAGGLLVIPGVLVTTFNGVFLGAAFGYMARPDVAEGENFFHFVTAHGPCELTAIVLSAGSGLRLGLAWMKTDGLTRSASLRKNAEETMPIMGAAMILFFMAALIEGFLSPSAAPYAIKAGVAIVTSCMLMFYFVVLGYPRDEDYDAA
ncbi:MAG: stage II sporulation protein M [Planctomycetales bacterium]|nr:stage II sporulation protein M [Planctomycetales bacterium]